MDILNKIKTTWMKMSTAEKINLFLDAICGFGSAAVSGCMMKSMAPKMNRIERFCASVAMSGLGIAAGDVACNAYKPYVEKIGELVDGKKNKEESEDGKYTRY